MTGRKRIAPLPGFRQTPGLTPIIPCCALGPMTQIELSRPDGELIEVSYSRDALAGLGLREGADVSLSPRAIRLFQKEPLAA